MRHKNLFLIFAIGLSLIVGDLLWYQAWQVGYDADLASVSYASIYVPNRYRREAAILAHQVEMIQTIDLDTAFEPIDRSITAVANQ